MQVTLRGDNVVGVTGDPENPDSRGFLCLRGRSAPEIIGNPRRLLYPQVRNERGSDRWTSISWAEAIDRIEDKLQAIAPEEFGIWLGHGDSATNYGTRLGGLLSRRFAHLYGAQWWHPAMICWGLGGFGLGLTGVLEVNTKEDLSAHADLIILWGANTASQPNTAPHLKAAVARGAKTIVIDVRASEATARAEQVLRIKPNSDAALALAMMHVIVNEGLFDREFIDAHTLGYSALHQHVQMYSPAWAVAHTGIDAQTIAQLARDYATTKRSMIVLGGSSMHKHEHGWQAARAIACLPGLTGKLGLPGGGLGPRHGATAHGQMLNSALPASVNACVAPIPNQMSAMTSAFNDKRIKALLLSGTNMMSSFADTNALARGLDNVEMIVCHDLFSSETIRRYADVVLPSTAWLEQLGCKMTQTHLYLLDKVLPAPGETHSLSQILRELAKRLDVSDFFPWENDEGYIDSVINHPSSNHATVDTLRAEGAKRAMNISHHAYPDHRYPTPSGKVEFYSDQALQLGLPALPVYTAQTSVERYPLQFCQGRTLTHFHSFYDEGRALPTLRKRSGKPTLWVATADAAERGIVNDARLRVFNDRGEFYADAFVTEKIDSGTVWMRDGWAGINRLTSGASCIPDTAVDLFAFSAGQSAFDAWVQIEAWQDS